jgi:hypothetical protein
MYRRREEVNMSRSEMVTTGGGHFLVYFFYQLPKYSNL